MVNNIMNLLKELKKIGIKRDDTYSIGKRMGEHIWIHKSSQHIVPDNIYNIVKDLSFDIIRLNKKNINEVALITVDDFNKKPEPIIQEVKVYKDINSNMYKTQKATNNPLIYHHKWLMVSESYSGFDVEQSMLRSLIWKKELGVDKSISSRIGRLDYWNEWLKLNKIEEKIELETISQILEPDSFDTNIWDFKKDNELIVGQTISSAKTSKKFSTGLPKSAKILDKLKLWKPFTIHLDLGCGSYFEDEDGITLKKFLAEKKIAAFGYDPYNQSYELNKRAVLNTHNGKADTVSLNNVLNTIKEDKVIEHILKQAQNALKKDGKIFILVYEGNESNIGTQTRDGWQRNEKLDKYLELIKKYFPDVEKKSSILIASKEIVSFDNKLIKRKIS